jgi:hypothetical protein
MSWLRLILTASSAIRAVLAAPSPAYVNWKTFESNGANLGAWLVQEKLLDTGFWDQYAGNATDEWGLCVNLGSRCGPVLEQRYASFITTATIDKLAGAGFSSLRIPTHYAAWIKVPGSQLYSGNQVNFLKTISDYAIKKYGMHVIIGLHSLPGGVNGRKLTSVKSKFAACLPRCYLSWLQELNTALRSAVLTLNVPEGIGEKDGNYGWFNNQTALNYSYQAVDAVINFIQSSGSPQSYTISPINEPVDNHDFSAFGTPDALSEEGATWTANFIQGVLAKVAAVNPGIPVMFQGSFRKESYWSSKFTAGSNLVFDTHNYYFAGRPTTSANVSDYLCADAKDSASDGKFPVFIGEWSIQAVSNNTLGSRKSNFNKGLYAWSKYARGSAPWTARMLGTDPVDGEGRWTDYWDMETFIDLGFVDPDSESGFCP